MKNYGWGSDNLTREVSYYIINTNKAVIEFRNGSWIKVVTASDSSRGNRANLLIVDEFRMVDKTTITTVLKRFLGSPRHPLYLDKKEYANRPEFLETNIEIYMSSCWFKSHWSYKKSQAFVVNLLGGRPGYFVCGIPYQMAIKEGLKKRIEIEDEMSEADFDATTFDMEMGCIPFGDSDNAFFAFDDISKCRKLRNPIYNPDNSVFAKNFKVPDLIFNERRILSVDVALMKSTRHNNDASSIIINSAIPTNNNYTMNLIFLANYEGLTTSELGLIVRKLYKTFKCTDIVIDTQGQGLGVYDCLIEDMVDKETGELYPALSCCNSKDMKERCKIETAPEVIWSIKATESFNNEMCLLLRNGFKNRKINLLISEFEAEEMLKNKYKNFSKMSAYEQMEYKMPYVQTTLLVYELINLEYTVKGNNIKITEKRNMRKDRYSSLGYNYWVQCQLEREMLHKPTIDTALSDYANAFRKLNKKPNMY